MSPGSYVDVLIIGAGPAGTTCANALAMAGGIDVKIIDKRRTNVTAGNASGIHPRTIEVFQSYGLAERLIREGNQIHECSFYNSGPNGGIECTGRLFDVVPPTARFPFQVILHQGEVEFILLDSMHDHGIDVERSTIPLAMEISEDVGELSSSSLYPVKVTLEHLDATGEARKSEIVHAKFVVGADGAHSWVRKILGIKMNGEQTDFVWGVIDLTLVTNFPDFRNYSAIHSTSGTCLLIPRERDMVRLYIQLSDTDIVDALTGKVDESKVNLETLLLLARNIFHPFELNVYPEQVERWIIYSIGQRIASNYSVKNRVFIVGDACHTHSAKAGQGMNAGINDSHNLAWKLVQVLRGWSNPSLLKTYQLERRKFAQDLIDFDKNIAARMSRNPKEEKTESNTNNGQFLRTSAEFISGIGIQYSSSAIVDPKHQTCANNLIIGKRMLPHALIRAADACPTELHDMLPADSRFKVLFFIGNLSDTRIAELNVLAEELNKSSSFLRKYSPSGNISAVFDIITITADKRGDINHLDIPPFFRPHWSKVLVDGTNVKGSRDGPVYEQFGIDSRQITLVVVRPDGYVGTIAPSIALVDLEMYFGSFLVPSSLGLSSDVV